MPFAQGGSSSKFNMIQHSRKSLQGFKKHNLKIVNFEKNLMSAQMSLVKVLKFRIWKGKGKGQYDENALIGWNDYWTILVKVWNKCKHDTLLVQV